MNLRLRKWPYHCVFHVVITLSLLSSCAGTGRKTVRIPAGIEKASTAVILLMAKERRSCSAVRVAPDLILTAAHCLTGINGDIPAKDSLPFSFKTDKNTFTLTLVEQGDFSHQKKHVQDWALLRIDKPEEMPDTIGVAPIITPNALAILLKEQADFERTRRGAPVFSITFPTSMVRMLPRPGHDGEGIFIAPGEIQSHDAFQKRILLAIRDHQYDDPIFVKQAPRVDFNLPREWDALEKDEGTPGKIYRTLNLFQQADVLLYHTADYSYGSSGGGIFTPEGALVGIIPVSAMFGSPTCAYTGTYSAYRIDQICRESKLMGKLPGCLRFR